MKLILYIIYFIIAFFLYIAIDTVNNRFAEIVACEKKVKAVRRGFILNANGKYVEKLKVSYVFEGKVITTFLSDERTMRYFQKHTKDDLEVYVNPEDPYKAFYFRKQALIQYVILYVFFVLLGVIDIVLVVKTIF